jgi:hypothetical protein
MRDRDKSVGFESSIMNVRVQPGILRGTLQTFSFAPAESLNEDHCATATSTLTRPPMSQVSFQEYGLPKEGGNTLALKSRRPLTRRPPSPSDKVTAIQSARGPAYRV